ncbi:glutamic acid-rich protein [Cynara cardunculus var. scolymus]|uniref:Histone chaperone domain CHZ n=1 Tax=Cynara cardunculus var. scolymus TaxID=59895 RepID=A0A103YHL5_CYNCS|nr:glutamic acid-rich protein [Cynara cardunculus var. scolymus]KVI09251.1 hypothetical protein Ccrd_012366 [Cynara cardunculus var. scolymus]
MAELNSNEEPHVLPSKRKQAAQDADADSTKKHRLEKCADNETLPEVEQKIIDENGDKVEEEEEEEEEEDYEGEEGVDSDDDEEEEDDDDEDEVEHSNGGGEIDRKGKGIMKDDKGKGKLIEESEEDDSDDDGASESDGDDDLSDDPLAEVDLDNILPSRTRRRTVPPGVRISSDKLTNDKDNDA